MKFCYINDQHAIVAEKISEVKLAGFEDADHRGSRQVNLMVIMDNGEKHRVSRHETFAAGQVALRKLTNDLDLLTSDQYRKE